ncbi:MAG: HTTM domain-containing protein [Myxococcales bacterium]|nr:HTTM domain-containing protein [Myxococcales bacterium]
MTGFDRFFHGPQAAIRPYLIIRIVPCMLALDAWMLMIGHAGRYGVADFNVAHFSLLDSLLPVPTAGGYIALLLVSGLLGIYVALTGIRPVAATALFATYTLSWAISMLDSYQHHYFLSLVLVCLIAFPSVCARDLARVSQESAHAAGDRETSTSAGFGYPLLACTVAILYVFAAVAKCDQQWVDGHTIRRISSAEALLEPLLALATDRGWSPQTIWTWMSTAVIPVEVALGLGYLVASQQDRASSRVTRGLSLATAALAVVLHVGAEAMALEIGWFSYYMLMFAVVYLLPEPALRWLAAPLLRIELAITDQLSDVESEARAGPTSATPALLALGVAGMLYYVGRKLQLPGAEAAAALGAAALVVAGVLHMAARAPDRIVRPALAVATATAIMWLAIAQSDVRWDFYRYLGGDLARRGHPEQALEAYLIGEAYAPEGQSRRNKIERLKRQLGR